jgi:oxalate oxidoreductase subunit delta
MRDHGATTEVTVWYRGVTEARLGRRIVTDLAAAASREGKFVQAFDNYADSPDRVNVPCRSYARLSPEPILEPYLYINEAPSVVIVTEATLVKGCDVVRGMRAPGALVINTDRAPQQMLEFLADVDTGALQTVATVDAGPGARPLLPYGAGEGTAEARLRDPGPAGMLLGAVARATGLVALHSLMEVEADHAGLQRGFETVRVFSNPAYRGRVEEERPAEGFRGRVDLIIKAPAPNGVNPGHISGNYRVLRPVINLERCTACGICWIFCPDAAISMPGPGGEKIWINYDYCKGCGICWQECNVDGAIRAEPELAFRGGVVRIAYGL